MLLKMSMTKCCETARLSKRMVSIIQSNWQYSTINHITWSCYMCMANKVFVVVKFTSS